jgi:oligoribonuclease
MHYLSIDIETSGLDPAYNQVLSIGAIFEDTEKKLSWDEIPKFHIGIIRHQITGSPRAINMNAKLIEWMGRWMEPKADLEQFNVLQESGMEWVEESEAAQKFYHFLCDCGLGESDNSGGYVEMKEGKTRPAFNSATKPITINVAGKNFGTFDKKFLELLPWWQKLIKVRQRILDPAIMFVDWKEDKSLPGLDRCKERAGIHGLVTHNALEDAWDVIELLRKHY